MLDDLADRRPWNLVVRLTRFRGRLRRRRDGVSVVVVSYNTRAVTVDTVAAVDRWTAAGVPVLVYDNASDDGSAEALSKNPRVDLVALRANVGHGVALDMAMGKVKTRHAVVLDSDAFPLNGQWLPFIHSLVGEPGVVVAGSRSRREFAHPFYLAIDVDEFLKRRLSFQVARAPETSVGEETWGVDAWDTGELLSRRLDSSEIRLIDRTRNPVDGLPGMTAGGLVYHHGGVSRTALAGGGDAAWDHAYRSLQGLDA